MRRDLARLAGVALVVSLLAGSPSVALPEGRGMDPSAAGVPTPVPFSAGIDLGPHETVHQATLVEQDLHTGPPSVRTAGISELSRPSVPGVDPPGLVPPLDQEPMPDCWAKTYGTDGRDGLLSAQFTDEGVVVSGALGGDETNSKDPSNGWVMLLGPKGTPLFSKSYGLSDSTDWLSSVKSVPAGGFAALGTRGLEAWLVRLDVLGNPLWERLYKGLPGHPRVMSSNPTSDGGFVLGGFGFGRQHDGFVLRVDAAGDVLWSRVIRRDDLEGETGVYDEVWDVRQTSDGGFIGVGWSARTDGTFIEDGFVFKLTPDGAVEWLNTYGTSHHDQLRWVAETHDGGFVATGITQVVLSHGGAKYGWLLAIDASGELQWQRAYALGADQEAFHVHPVHGGQDGYLLGGTTRSGSRDGWIWKVDATGVPEWSRTYGGEGDDYLRLVHPSHDDQHGLVAAGYTTSFGGGDNDGWVLRLAENGDVAPIDGTGFVATDTTDDLNHWAPDVETFPNALGVGEGLASARELLDGGPSLAVDVVPETRPLAEGCPEH